MAKNKTYTENEIADLIRNSLRLPYESRAWATSLTLPQLLKTLKADRAWYKEVFKKIIKARSILDKIYS